MDAGERQESPARGRGQAQPACRASLLATPVPWPPASQRGWCDNVLSLCPSWGIPHLENLTIFNSVLPMGFSPWQVHYGFRDEISSLDWTFGRNRLSSFSDAEAAFRLRACSWEAKSYFKSTKQSGFLIKLNSKMKAIITQIYWAN